MKWIRRFKNQGFRFCLTGILILFFSSITMLFSQEVPIWKPVTQSDNREVGIQVIESDIERTVLEYSVNGYFFEQLMIDDQPYMKVVLPGATPLMMKGFPNLPKVRKNIIIPDDAKMQFKVIATEDTMLTTDLIAPSKGHLPRTVDPDTIPYTFDEFYQKNEWFPEGPFELGEAFIFKDYRGLTLQFNPFQFNPAEKTLRVITKFRVEVFVDRGTTGENIKNRTRDEIKISPDMKKIYQRQFLNYDFLTARYTPIEEGPGRLLIIVYDDFASSITPFVEWKTSKGIPTVVARYPTDISAGSGNIKNYIQTLYNASEGLTYIILVGDSDQIPTLTGDHADAAPSDPMYVKLEGSDHYPDAFISRISATTAAEVTYQVTKFINYEKSPDTGSSASWYEKGTGIACDQGTPKDWERADLLRTDLLSYGYTLVDQIYDPGATDTDVSNAINDGRSIINYLGHGGTTNWTTTGFNNADIDALTNSNKQPFIIDVACVNGFFTKTGGDCFAERWLKAGTLTQPKGAIGIYAASTNADWVPPCVMQAEAIDLLIAEDVVTLGGLCFNGVMQALDDYPYGQGQKLMEQYNLFGDCTMEVRTQKTKEMDVVHATSAPAYTNDFVVAVKKKGTSSMVPEATVTLTKDGKIVGSKTTDTTYPDKGTAKFSFNESSGKMKVTVTKPNYAPYFGEVSLIPMYGKLWISLHGGMTYPYDDWYEETACFNAIVNLEYHFYNYWAAVLEVGYNNFKTVGELNNDPWWNISATVRRIYPIKQFRPFVNAGPGYYIPKDGDHQVGVKTGIGVDYLLSENITLEMGTDFHNVFDVYDSLKERTENKAFQHFHAGVLFKIK
ncbi:MAG: hypothetical protein DWQ02_25535 [Bacteroidetes bacterium]|nr:MAG: hypothetical protein DWQ02_25535 [Bacteroidota bacterium]